GVDERTQAAVWRQAMPRGQGWGADAFAGAQSLKCFPIDGGRMAVSSVTVTDESDELGRRGIRRAGVSIVPARAYRGYGQARRDARPREVREAAGEQFVGYRWQRIVDRALLRGRRVVRTAPYTGPASWQYVEALVLRLVTSPGIRLFEGWGPLTPFTTLALDWRDEGQIVGVPRNYLDGARGVSVIHA